MANHRKEQVITGVPFEQGVLVAAQPFSFVRGLS